MNRRQIVRTCKKYGLNLHPKALQAIQESPISSEDDFVRVLQYIKKTHTNTPVSGPLIISKELWEQTLVDLVETTNAAADAADEAGPLAVVSPAATTSTRQSNSQRHQQKTRPQFKVLNAFDTPRLVYDSLRQQFNHVSIEDEQASSPSTSLLLGSAKDKIEMITQRYQLIHQRVLRNELFKPRPTNAYQAEDDTPKLTLTSIDRLLGSAGSTSHHLSNTTFVLLGMLTTNPGADNLSSSHPICLEDLTGKVTLNLQNAEAADKEGGGFYTEQSMVLVQGHYEDDDTFHVHRMGFPPLETKEESELILPTSSRNQPFSSTTPPLEVLVFSNAHLDDPDVLSQLQAIFQELQDQVKRNVVLCLMGNFSSTGGSSGGTAAALDELALLIDQFPHVARHVQMVLIPGPDDCHGMTLPQHPLKSHAFNHLPKVQMASNPCRIQYGAAEMVLFRHALSQVLPQQELFQLKNASTSSMSTTSERLSRTLLEQGHLLPLAGLPIYWNFDHAMRLYPVPDAVVLGSSQDEEPFHHHMGGCHVVCPGSVSVKGRYAKYMLHANGNSLSSKNPVQLYQEE
jgi:DNA polymerase epsilon subunit 2